MKKAGIVLASVIVAAVAAASCAAPESSQAITIKGSDTMVLLGQRWAELFMKAHPDFTIQVTGGGSGTGIAALINGTTQIAESSRPIKNEEKESVRAQRNAEVVEIPVALDALAVYVHKDNPLTSLTLEQVKGIYTGTISDWKDVGGSAGKIVLYGRENNSGTYVYFKEHVLANEDFVNTYQAMPGTASVINAVTKDSLGIGYGGIGYATELKALPIAVKAGDPPVTPSMENVLSNTYPISRQLYWYIAGEPQGQIKTLIDWVLSPDGQKVVTEVGYYPLRQPSASQ